LLVLELVSSAGMQVTDNLSAGASFQFGTGILDPPFAGIGRATPAYAVRGSFGLDYDLNNDTTLGVYYQTRQNFKFEDAILLSQPGGGFSAALDVSQSLPRNIGFGIANNSLMDGNLLLAADVLWKNWDDTDFFEAVYQDQWVVQLGSQLTQGRYKLRAGYVWAENPVQSPPGNGTAGGVTPPGLLAAVQFMQAQVAVINQHRLSAGIGIENVIPHVDLDFSAGGMLHDSQRLGATNVGVSSYYLAFGLTWRFGGCSNGCGDSCGDGCALPPINHSL